MAYTLNGLPALTVYAASWWLARRSCRATHQPGCGFTGPGTIKYTIKTRRTSAKRPVQSCGHLLQYQLRAIQYCVHRVCCYRSSVGQRTFDLQHAPLQAVNRAASVHERATSAALPDRGQPSDWLSLQPRVGRRTEWETNGDAASGERRRVVSARRPRTPHGESEGRQPCARRHNNRHRHRHLFV